MGKDLSDLAAELDAAVSAQREMELRFWRWAVRVLIGALAALGLYVWTQIGGLFDFREGGSR